MSVGRLYREPGWTNMNKVDDVTGPTTRPLPLVRPEKGPLWPIEFFKRIEILPQEFYASI